MEIIRPESCRSHKKLDVFRVVASLSRPAKPRGPTFKRYSR